MIFFTWNQCCGSEKNKNKIVGKKLGRVLMGHVIDKGKE